LILPLFMHEVFKGVTSHVILGSLQHIEGDHFLH